MTVTRDKLGCLFAAALAAAVATTAGKAHATETEARESEAVRVSVTGSGGTCNAGEFSRELARRTTLVRPAEPGEPALTFAIELASTPHAARGRLTIVESDGRRTTRDVAGANCHEVLSAMALIAALAVDPFASLSAEPEPVRVPQPESAPVPSVLERAAGTRDRQRRLSWRVGYRVIARTAIAPGLTAGQSIGVGVGYDDGVLEPRVTIDASLARSATVDGPGASSAAFEWRSLHLTVCPLRWQAVYRLSLRPCALVEGGRLAGRGTGADAASSPSAPWWAVGGELAVDASIVGPLAAEASASLFVPLTGSRFFFAPDTPENTVHEVPRLGFGAGVGLGLLFF